VVDLPLLQTLQIPPLVVVIDLVHPLLGLLVEICGFLLELFLQVLDVALHQLEVLLLLSLLLHNVVSLLFLVFLNLLHVFGLTQEVLLPTAVLLFVLVLVQVFQVWLF